METCKCGRWVAGQTIALNKKFLGRNTQKFMCIDCLAKFLGTTREVLFDRIRDFIEIEKCELFQDEKFNRNRTALKRAQTLPLPEKLRIACERITEWYYFYKGQVYVSFSGGKDSTVLLHIVRKLFPDVEAVFVNTGLEYPEIQQFAKTFDNVTILRPKMRFDEVIKTYGYPLIGKSVANKVRLAKQNIKDGKYSLRLRLLGVLPNDIDGLEKISNKDYEKASINSKFCSPKYKPLLDVDFEISEQCCDVMKKAPIYEFEKQTGKKGIVATMAQESDIREAAWTKNGCNAFKSKRPKSTPMAFWLNQDVLKYIKQNELKTSSVYGDIICYKDGFEYYNCFFDDCDYRTTGCDRTGCIFCAFGCHLEKSPTRFERLKITHPRQYEYCIGGGEYNENGVWQPNKQGLGMGHVFDELNEIYGKDFIKY
jgi:3'-phosphoadenosine 5'-phosphosulfate sulfotransferase (PAPS reductase)/FAD synthetase